MKKKLSLLAVLILLLMAFSFAIGPTRSVAAFDCCGDACAGLQGKDLTRCIRACLHDPGGPCPNQ